VVISLKRKKQEEKNAMNVKKKKERKTPCGKKNLSLSHGLIAHNSATALYTPCFRVAAPRRISDLYGNLHTSYISSQ